jgi:hypothetical protein
MAKSSNYFKTITLGLTATPTDIIDHNTFQLFHCEDGLPTFAYTFEEAVNNVPPYLCSFQVMKIQTRFQMEGISKRTISLEDQKKLLLEGKEIEEINFEGSQLEKAGDQQGDQHPHRQRVHGGVHQGRQRRTARQNHLFLLLQSPCPAHRRDLRQALSAVQRRVGQGAGLR